MKRWLLMGLVALLGCVACEKNEDSRKMTPPYEEEIASFDWATVDGEALKQRLMADACSLSAEWSFRGAQGWFESSMLHYFNRYLVEGYLFFEDGIGWKCVMRGSWEDTSFWEYYHVPFQWEFDVEKGVLLVTPEKSQKTESWYVLYYDRETRLVIGNEPRPGVEASQQLEIRFSEHNYAEWLEKYAPTK